MESYFSEFMLIAITHWIAMASPGPDFAMVLKQSVTYGRKTAIWTSLGIGLGIFVHVTYTIMGIGIVVSQSIVAFNVMKYVGACYLIFIGINAIRAKKVGCENVQQEERDVISARRAFTLGFLTNALNPKVTLFFLSLFSVVISSSTPVAVQVGYGIYMAIVTAIWFVSLSLLLAQSHVRLWFRKFGHWFERSMGGILIALGIRLAFVEK